MSNVLAWMAALGVQLDDHQPDARQLEHMAAVRAANARTRSPSALTRLARIVGFIPAASPAGAGSLTACCTA